MFFHGFRSDFLAKMMVSRRCSSISQRFWLLRPLYGAKMVCLGSLESLGRGRGGVEKEQKYRPRVGEPKCRFQREFPSRKRLGMAENGLKVVFSSPFSR